MRVRISSIFLVVAALAYGGIQLRAALMRPATYAAPSAETSGRQTVAVELHPMRSLNFLTRADILAARKKHVQEQAALVERLGREPYEPDSAVFGGIVDKRPWWGLLGLCYYGDGLKSIEGVSRESLFIDNPFLFVGLSEVSAYRITGRPPTIFFPTPSTLRWSTDGSYGWVKYENVESCFQKMERLGIKDRELELHAYNARDFGFFFMAVDQARSRNAGMKQPRTEAFPLPHYIHCGGSCGYPGGCNNVSPHSPNFVVRVGATPAILYFKLWRERPDDASRDPDGWFVIEMAK